jgi:rod shape-determining protein MreC
LHGSATGHVVINNLTPDSRIKPGEQVLTSGGDQVYPRGLPVGTIESIVLDPDHQPYTLIQIKPAANLFQLEEVLIITGTQSNLPELAQKDLGQGAATAQQQAEAKAAAKAAADEAAAEAAAQSAAQVVADRLPSIHDAETAADSNSPAGSAAKPTPTNPAGVVPKPLPTVHPDRYSPGTTPPASTLTPGAGHPAGAVAAPAPHSTTTPSTQEDQPKPQPPSPNN